MNLLFCIVYFIELMVVLYLSKKKYGSIFVPVSIFTLCWTIFPILANIRVLGINAISLESNFCIFISSFTFIFVSFLMKSKKNKFLNYKTNLNYFLLILANISVLLWMFGFAASSLQIISTKGWIYLRAHSTTVLSESTIINILYIWFVKPFVFAALALTISDFLYSNNRNTLSLIALSLSIINTFLDSIIFAGRATLVKFVFYFIFALFFCGKHKLNIKQIIFGGIALFFVLSFINTITTERMSNFSAIESIEMYYVGPIGLFNYYINNPSFSLINSFGDLTWGTAMFGFIYNIIRSIFYVLFGFKYNGSDYLLTLVSQQYVNIGNHITLNAGSTAMYIFIRDFGFVGLIIGFSLFAYFSNFVRRKYIDEPSSRSNAIYIIVLYTVFRTIQTYDFLGPDTFFAIIYVWLFTAKFGQGGIKTNVFKSNF